MEPGDRRRETPSSTSAGRPAVEDCCVGAARGGLVGCFGCRVGSVHPIALVRTRVRDAALVAKASRVGNNRCVRDLADFARHAWRRSCRPRNGAELWARYGQRSPQSRGDEYAVMGSRARRRLEPQGLAVVEGSLLISAYQSDRFGVNRGPCRVFRVDPGNGRETGHFDVPPPCGHAGGLAYDDDGKLYIADTRTYSKSI
jgi:hypothetical protein